MAEFGISPEELKHLVKLVEDNGLSELRLGEGDLRITLRTAAYRASVAAPRMASVASAPDDPVSGEFTDEGFEIGVLPVPTAAITANVLRVEAPIMGVFYRTAGPKDPPFIEVGDVLEVGQVVGVIEAMKVFSEVPSDHAGRVLDIPAKNGGLVQPGDPLVVLEAA